MAFKEKISTASKVLAISTVSLFLSCHLKTEPAQTKAETLGWAPRQKLTIAFSQAVQNGIPMRAEVVRDTGQLTNAGQTLFFTLTSLGASQGDTLVQPNLSVSDSTGSVFYRGSISGQAPISFTSKGRWYYCQTTATKSSQIDVTAMTNNGQPTVFISQEATMEVIYQTPQKQ